MPEISAENTELSYL